MKATFLTAWVALTGMLFFQHDPLDAAVRSAAGALLLSVGYAIARMWSRRKEGKRP